MTGLTDGFGRAVTIEGDAYSVPGITITAPNQATALATLNSMAPPGYTPPNDNLRFIPALAFVQRFTAAEQLTLMSANSPWGVQVAAAGTIDVTNELLIADMQAAVTAGALLQARMTQILDLSQTSP